MPRALSPILAASLLLFAISGCAVDYRSLLRMLALAILAIALLAAIYFEPSTQRWTRYVLALAMAAFANLSGVGSVARQSLGESIWIAFNFLALGFLLFHLWKARRPRSNPFLGISLVLAILLPLAAIFFIPPIPSPMEIAMRTAVSWTGLLAFFLLCCLPAGGRRWEIAWAAATILALLVALSLGIARFWGIHNNLARAARAYAAKNPSSAISHLKKAEAANSGLQWAPFEFRRHRLLSQISEAQGNPGQALREMAQYMEQKRRPGLLQADLDLRLEGYPVGQVIAFYSDYLQPAPLAPLYEKYSKPHQIELFLQTRGKSPRDLIDDARLLTLFVQNGFLDRLMDRYALTGLRDIAPLAPLERPLARAFSGLPDPQKPNALFLIAMAQYADGKYPQALQTIHSVLKDRPQNHNAIVYAERIAAILGEKSLLTEMQARKREITLDMMAGNRKWGMNVDDILWAAFEANPGRYNLAIQVRGIPALGIDPIFAIIWSKAETATPIYRAPISPGKWHTIQLSRHYADQECERLELRFENDSYAPSPEGKIENRAVLFRPIQIEFLPDIPLDTSQTLRQN